MNKSFLLLILIVVFNTSFYFAHCKLRINIENHDTTTFEEFGLPPNTYWNGSDGNGGFLSGSLYFPNNYDPLYMSWSGWAYSNIQDNTTPGYTNQYSAITAAGYDTIASGGSTYGVAYVPSDWMNAQSIPISLIPNDPGLFSIDGFYVTNSTFAALSMEFGDAIAKKFGGVSGNDPDWFKLSIKGFQNGLETGQVDFYLADYRFENNNEDYIIKTWEWVDLAALGYIDSLLFDLSSTDNGVYGMNTPAYFCVDNFYSTQEYVNTQQFQNTEPEQITISPNPSQGVFKIQYSSNTFHELKIYNEVGRLILNDDQYYSNNKISVRSKGLHIIKLKNKESEIYKKIFIY